MWSVALILIAVANCNAKSCRPQTTELPMTAVKSRENRIIGGTETSIEKYPFAVQIYIFFNKTSFWTCGGSLLTKSHILSAAHCFFTDDTLMGPERCAIREGSTYLDKGGEIHRVTAIKIHEQYNIPPVNNDVAVVLMTTPVDQTVSVARMASIPYQDAVVPNDASVTAIGWGQTDLDSNETSSSVLNEVTIRTIDLSICQLRYKWLQNESDIEDVPDVTDNMICAGILDVGGKDACQGDSGGPLIYKGVVVGITSWGIGCAEPHFPGLFTKVASFSTWINNTINDSSIQFQAINGNSSTDSLSSKIRFATLLSLILYFMLSG